MNIYVGNLPYSYDGNALRQLFEAYGEVTSAQVINDRETGRSRGFGFVEMPDDAARQAIEELADTEIGGRRLTVNEARPRGGGRWWPPALLTDASAVQLIYSRKPAEPAGFLARGPRRAWLAGGRVRSTSRDDPSTQDGTTGLSGSSAVTSSAMIWSTSSARSHSARCRTMPCLSTTYDMFGRLPSAMWVDCPISSTTTGHHHILHGDELLGVLDLLLICGRLAAHP